MARQHMRKQAGGAQPNDATDGDNDEANQDDNKQSDAGDGSGAGGSPVDDDPGDSDDDDPGDSDDDGEDKDNGSDNNQNKKNEKDKGGDDGGDEDDGNDKNKDDKEESISVPIDWAALGYNDLDDHKYIDQLDELLLETGDGQPTWVLKPRKVFEGDDCVVEYIKNCRLDHRRKCMYTLVVLCDLYRYTRRAFVCY